MNDKITAEQILACGKEVLTDTNLRRNKLPPDARTMDICKAAETFIEETEGRLNLGTTKRTFGQIKLNETAYPEIAEMYDAAAHTSGGNRFMQAAFVAAVKNPAILPDRERETVEKWIDAKGASPEHLANTLNALFTAANISQLYYGTHRNQATGI